MARIAPEGFVMPDNILDPNTATRDDFSKQAMAFEIPADASQDYKKYAEPLKDLYGHLAYHKAMASNLHQTFMTPAASKNRVYFMWDFVGRTLSMLKALPPTITVASMNDAQLEMYEDVQLRSQLTCDLILNKTPGMLNQKMEMLYPDQAHNHPDFGDAVLEDARKLDEVFPGKFEGEHSVRR